MDLGGDIRGSGAERLVALAEMGLTSSDSDGAFDTFARLARQLSGAHRAFVSFLANETVWLKGAAGSDERVIDRECFCHHALRSSEVLCVEDLAADDRFTRTTLHRYYPTHASYAGVPITLSDGLRIGAVCISFDDRRSFASELLDSLRDLADAIAAQCERRRDLSRLKKALDDSAAADALISNLIEHAPVALALVDRDMRFVRVSPRYLSEMGVGDADITQKRLDETFPDLVKRWPNVLQRCLEGETIRGDAVRTFRYDGAPVCLRVELVPWRSASDRIEGILVMTHDISDLMVSIRETERSEDRLKLAVDIANQLVFDCDIRTGQLYHQGALALLGDAPPKVVRGPHDFLASMHPEDRSRVLAEWRLAMADGRSRLSTEYRVQHQGETLWVASTSEMFNDRNGRPTRLLGVLQDVTGHHAAAAAMIEARDQAEAANRAKSEFLANMSHEIRTPLNGVLGVAGALASTRLDEQQAEMVGLIETSAVSLERLLSDVLDLSRVESGRFDLQMEPFELMSLLAGVTALFEPRAREKGVSFMFSPALEACGLYVGDAARIRQILSNLLSNAIKFTTEGEVRLAVEAVAGAAADRQRLRFSVSDTGIGFKPADKHRLFQRFEQADGSVTRKFGGSGLGLAISKALAERMDGKLDAEPGPCRGAVFTLELDLVPAERNTEAEPSVLHDSQATGARPLRILLAEDHPVNRRVVELILEAIDADLTSVDDGAAAVRLWETGLFDLVLMDLQMPVMDGLTAIRAIRQRELESGRERTPILALTANAMPEHVRATSEAGADGHIAKPIRAPDLLNAVAAAVIPPEPAMSDRHSA